MTLFFLKRFATLVTEKLACKATRKGKCTLEAEYEQTSLYSELDRARDTAAAAFFESGGLQLDLETGFRTTIHDSYQDAPLQPYQFRLITEEIHTKPTLREALAQIAYSMLLTAIHADLLNHSRSIVDVPRTGTTLLSLMLQNQKDVWRGNVHRPITFKGCGNGKRMFDVGVTDDTPLHHCLLVDSHLTTIEGKQPMMKAIERRNGCVSDILVFVNNSTNARDTLACQGIRLHAVFEYTQLFDWGLGHGHLSRPVYEEIVEYPDLLAAYVASRR